MKIITFQVVLPDEVSGTQLGFIGSVIEQRIEDYLDQTKWRDNYKVLLTNVEQRDENTN